MEDSIVIPTLEEFRKTQNEQSSVKHRSRSLGKGAKLSSVYDIRQERPPDLPFYKLDKLKIDNKIKNISDIVKAISSSAHSNDHDLASIGTHAQKVRMVAATAPVSIAMVGSQAMGKSLLINAILNRPNVSKISSDGGACTATPTRFIPKPGVDEYYDKYDAIVQFMDDASLQDIIAEHARHYFHFHHSDLVDESSRDDDKIAADTAREFFDLIFDANSSQEHENRLAGLLTKSEIHNGALKHAALEMASHRIEKAGADESRTKCFFDMDIDSLREAIDNYVAQSVNHDDSSENGSKLGVSLWPLVQDVSVRMGAAILAASLSIIDLPGLGDLNQSRTVATNEVRRSVDYEIIAARADRIETDEFVNKQLIQSIRQHGAKNTILVLTRKDEYFHDNANINEQIRSCKREPLPTIKAYRKETENALQELNRRLATEDINCEDCDEESKTLQAYLERLRIEAARALVNHRAQRLEIRIKHKFKDEDSDPIHVFSVSAAEYLDWLQPFKLKQPVLSVEETGIPKLRQFLLGLTSERSFERYRDHVTCQLPHFLDRVARITHAKKDNTYVRLRPGFKESVTLLKDNCDEKFDSFIAEGMLPIHKDAAQKQNQLTKISTIVKDWGEDVAWNTYNKVLRERGSMTKSKARKYLQNRGEVNWNLDISNELRPDMLSWELRMNANIQSFSKRIMEIILIFSNRVVDFIQGSSLARNLKQVATEEWDKRNLQLLDHCFHLEGFLKQQIHATYLYASTETDVGCMLARLNAPVYKEVLKAGRTEHGPYAAQKEKMMNCMIGVDAKKLSILDRVESKVHKKAEIKLRTRFASFIEGLVKEANLFDEHIADYLPLGDNLTPASQKARNNLKSMEPILRGILDQLKADVNAVKGSKDVRESQGEDEDSTPPAKKRKIDVTE